MSLWVWIDLYQVGRHYKVRSDLQMGCTQYESHSGTSHPP